MSTDEPSERYAAVYGSPGEMARVTGLVRTLWPVLLLMAIAGYLLRAAVPWPAVSPGLAGALCLLLVVAAAVLATMLERRFSAYLKGARGEERVAHALGFLPADYTVFHGLSRERARLLGGEDFDHIVVGRAGVAVIETKNWARPVTVRDGELRYGGAVPTRSPLEQVRRGARQLEQQLAADGVGDVSVRAIVCFAESVLVDGPRLVGEVAICTTGDLPDVLTEVAGTPVADETRQRIVDALRRQAAADGADAL